MEYGLLGEKLGHSFSPQIHSQLAGYSYELVEKRLRKWRHFSKGENFRGLNVTIPL